ncbi:hypothetical protein MTO96_027648 [Rhipicephalus appendiculatus]
MRANFRTFVRRVEKEEDSCRPAHERLLFLVTTSAIIDDRGSRKKPPAHSPSPSKSLNAGLPVHRSPHEHTHVLGAPLRWSTDQFEHGARHRWRLPGFIASKEGPRTPHRTPNRPYNDHMTRMAVPSRCGQRGGQETRRRLQAEAIAELREAFALLHKDRNREISPEDLGITKRAFGQNPTQAEIEEMIAEVDTVYNRTVDFPEFVAKVTEDAFTTPTEEEIRGVFKLFDRDGNGFITAAEMRCVFTAFNEPVTDEEVDDMIREVDMDGDGQISYVEFVAFVTSPYLSK